MSIFNEKHQIGLSLHQERVIRSTYEAKNVNEFSYFTMPLPMQWYSQCSFGSDNAELCLEVAMTSSHDTIIINISDVLRLGAGFVLTPSPIK